MMTPSQILQDAYDQALQRDGQLDSQQQTYVQAIVRHAESQKAVLAVVVTSLTRKIEQPTQDIRQHKIELHGGYSGRSYDTNHVTPFIREYFPPLAMRSGSGWLTRSLEQAHAFTRDFPGKISKPEVKTAFLEILNDVQENRANSTEYLISIFHGLHQVFAPQTNIPYQLADSQLTVRQITHMLEQHFFFSYNIAGTSRLPVLAIYSLYELLLITNPRYQAKQLLPLKSHHTADAKSRSIGDIEVINADSSYFEAVEIKHQIPIQPGMLHNAFEKIETLPVKRY